MNVIATRLPETLAGHPLSSGRPEPLGATFDGEGVNFAVFSAHAELVELCLFTEDGTTERARIPLRERDGDVWHVRVAGLGPGTCYGYRVHGPYAPEDGHRFNPNKLLLDPYAKKLTGKLTWNVTPKLAVTGAVGQLDIDNPGTPGGNNSVSDESNFYDLQVSYQVNKSLKTWVTYGILEENEAGALSGNTLLGALPSADFSQDDVQAASVNLAVSF